MEIQGHAMTTYNFLYPYAARPRSILIFLQWYSVDEDP